MNSKFASEAVFHYLNEMPTKEMVAKIISGVKKDEVPSFKSNSFAEFISSSYPF